MRNVYVLSAMTVMVGMVAGVAAQQAGQGSSQERRGQGDAGMQTKMVTVTGCLERTLATGATARGSATGGGGSAAQTTTPAMFKLTNATMAGGAGAAGYSSGGTTAGTAARSQPGQTQSGQSGPTGQYGRTGQNGQAGENGEAGQAGQTRQAGQAGQSKQSGHGSDMKSAHEYRVMAAPGSSIDLSGHVNHQVELKGTLGNYHHRDGGAASAERSNNTATATVGSASTGSGTARTGQATQNGGHGVGAGMTLQVANLKMMSATCSRQ